MKIACFTLTYWTNPDNAKNKAPELEAWKKQVEKNLRPDVIYLACGTKSDPALKPIDLPVINAEVVCTKPYDVFNWCYALCAESAGMWYALLNTDCDVVVNIASDCVLNTDLRDLAQKFMERPELVCAPTWGDKWLEDAAVLYKRQGLTKFLNGRLRPNLSEGNEKLLTEMEKAHIFNGYWWNPWPNIPAMRQEYGIPHEKVVEDSRVISENWPIILRPSPTIRKRYEV
jgi:hypothetical protein